MLNLKTKFDKHANDNEKRRKSLKEKEKTKLNQSLIIKEALSNTSLHDHSNKKIIFCDDENVTFGKVNSSKNNVNGNGKSLLFDSSENENEDSEITEKTQFIGKKGFELLNLQSTYGNDERFKIDERFIEDKKVGFYQDKINTPDSEDAAEEKVKQLKILESVLGTPPIELQQEKNRKRTYEMVRYDASNKNHEIYEISIQSESLNSHSSSKKKKERNKLLMTEREESTEVSNEKFYKVSNEIKFCFKEMKEGNDQFSLLQTYALNNTENNLTENNMINYREKEVKEIVFINEECLTNNDCSVNKRVKKQIDEPKKEERNVTAKGIWKESFFFIQDDPRIKEGLEFINKKDSAEASETAGNYNQMRKKLKEILRLHLKKQMHKKDPFKNKIGGMNKKQLLNSKLKIPMIFNKRKPFKKNPVGKI